MSNASTELAQRPLGAAIRIDVYSHHIKITNFTRQVQKALLDYCRGLALYGLKRVGRGKFVKDMLRVFVGVTHDRSEFRFHINQLDELLKYLASHGYSGRLINLVRHEVTPPTTVEYDYVDKRNPRDGQGEQIDYVLQDGISKVITARPGRGKTYMALRAIYLMKVKAFFCIRPMYIEKWIIDIKEAFKLGKDDLMVVRGGDHLKALVNLGIEGKLDAKIVLCSNKTFFNYLKEYERFPDQLEALGYNCTPENFYDTLGFPFRVIDEVHQDFHLNFRQDLYTHIWKTLSLSGTLESDDAFITEMYDVMFPRHTRGPKMDDTSHVAVRALLYGFNNVERRIRYENKAMKSYSHVMFEQNLMKKPELLKPYINMITDLVNKTYANKRQDGQKMIVYCSTVELCTIVANRLKKIHPDIAVTRYVSEDDYEEMLECDLIVSTLKSLGTAIDIPGLMAILMTDAIGSRQANLQAVERLRDPKGRWGEQRPEFYYLVCKDIDKHMKYHEHKKDVFRGRVVEHKEFQIAHHI